MPLWLEVILGWVLLLADGATNYVSKHWIGIVILFAFFWAWHISRLLEEANLRLKSIADSLDVMSFEDREKQRREREAEYFGGFGYDEDEEDEEA